MLDRGRDILREWEKSEKARQSAGYVMRPTSPQGNPVASMRMPMTAAGNVSRPMTQAARPQPPISIPMTAAGNVPQPMTQAARPQPPQVQALSVGQDVEMFSSHLNAWLPSKVMAVHSDGRVDVEAKIQKSIQASEIPRALRSAGSRPSTANQITVKFASGKSCWEHAYKPLQVSLAWKVKDLVAAAGLSKGMLFANRQVRMVPNEFGVLTNMSNNGVCVLKVQEEGGTTLDLEDPASWEKPVSVLNLSHGCSVFLNSC